MEVLQENIGKNVGDPHIGCRGDSWALKYLLSINIRPFGFAILFRPSSLHRCSIPP